MAEVLETERQRGWWSRNWKWVIPVGVVAPLLLCGTCFAVVIFGVFSTLRSHEVTQRSFERAKNDPEVLALLGQPIDMGRFISGEIRSTGGTDEANVAIPISGPNGAAIIEAEAAKSGGAWNYSKMVVVPRDGGQPIDLLAKGG